MAGANSNVRHIKVAIIAASGVINVTSHKSQVCSSHAIEATEVKLSKIQYKTGWHERDNALSWYNGMLV